MPSLPRAGNEHERNRVGDQSSDAVSQSIDERFGQSLVPHLLLRLFDRVGDAPEGESELIGLKDGEGCATVPVSSAVQPIQD